MATNLIQFWDQLKLEGILQVIGMMVDHTPTGMVAPKAAAKVMAHSSIQVDMIKVTKDIAELPMRSKGGFNVGVEKHMVQRGA